MRFCFSVAVIVAGGIAGAATAHAQAQFGKPAFDADLLQITPQRITAFEAALRKPPEKSGPAFNQAQLQERVAKAKTEAEVKKIVAEIQAQAAAGGTASGSGLPDIAQPYEDAREAGRKWDACVGKGRSEASVKAGAATVATDAAVRARVAEDEKRAVAACGERPKLPAAPVPASWTESGRSFYVMLDRVGTYCRELAGDSGLQMERSPQGVVRWNSGETDGFGDPKYYVYLASEIDAMKPRCEPLVMTIDEALDS